jgi:hypothetical protein
LLEVGLPVSPVEHALAALEDHRMVAEECLATLVFVQTSTSIATAVTVFLRLD